MEVFLQRRGSKIPSWRLPPTKAFGNRSVRVALMVMISVIAGSGSPNRSSPLWTCGDQAMMMGEVKSFHKRTNPKRRRNGTVLKGILLHDSLTSSIICIIQLTVLDNVSRLFRFWVVMQLQNSNFGQALVDVSILSQFDEFSGSLFDGCNI